VFNGEAIGAIGEVLRAAGVILALGYSSMQVKASTAASRVESKLAASRMYTDFLRTRIESELTGSLTSQGRRDAVTGAPA